MEQGAKWSREENIEPAVRWEEVSQKRWALDWYLLKREGREVHPGREKIDKSTEALEHIAAQLWGEAGKMDSAPGEGTSCCDEDSGFHPATRGAMRGPKQGHETPEAKKWSLCPRLFQKTFTHKHLPCL